MNSTEELRVMGSILLHCAKWLKADTRSRRYAQLKALRRNVDTLILLHRKEDIRSE